MVLTLQEVPEDRELKLCGANTARSSRRQRVH